MYDTKSDWCLWEGIKCNPTTQRVVEIDLGITLNLKNLSLLNISLLHPFEYVRFLNLSGNYFKGMFDDVEGYKSLGRLRNLETLDLSSNSFDDSIFPFLNAATSLTALSLRSNKYLTGPFPGKGLEDLTNLELLELSGCRFNDSLEVQDLYTLKMLKYLDLSNNMFSDPMRFQGNKSLSRRLRNLEILNLSENFFDSMLPFLNAVTSLKALFMGYNFMHGSFPAEELKDLANLELLDLSQNDFNGSIPIRDLSALRKLRALDLSGNKFSASMGWQGICEMKNMQELDLSRNKFVGEFPLCLTGLAGLRVLDLSSNQLNGKLPSTLGNLGSLRYLSLLDNNFEGSFSVGFLANLSELRVFKLDSKSKSLQVKTEGSSIPKFQLSVIELPSCNLVKIPYFLLSQKDLSRIDLSDNNIYGDFPQWLLVNNTKLEVLFLQSNSFTSFQLQESAHNLRFLDVSANAFDQHLPDDIGWLLPHLTYMKLAGNGFQGGLPSSLGNMQRIKYLDVSYNSFHGKIPRSLLMGCYSMRFLTLSHNKLSGEVFPESANFSSILELSMDNNLFTGKIRNQPTSFAFGKEDSSDDQGNYGNITRVILSIFVDTDEKYFESIIMIDEVKIDTPSVQIQIAFATKHRYDAYVGRNLELLFGMDLSGNELSGDIPTELGGLLELQSLNLSHNNLSGSVPESFSGLKNVESLDLSFNKLQGLIPSQLTELSSLAVFNVSFNNLSGFIPRGKQFDTFDSQSYLGNPLLCGQPTNTSCDNINNFQQPDNNGVEADESIVNMVSFYWSLAAAYVAILLGICSSLFFDSPWSRFWFYLVDAFIHKAKNLLW